MVTNSNCCELFSNLFSTNILKNLAKLGPQLLDDGADEAVKRREMVEWTQSLPIAGFRLHRRDFSLVFRRTMLGPLIAAECRQKTIVPSSMTSDLLAALSACHDPVVAVVAC